jgi:chorismate mutase/prephenate dehydrogenase
MGDAQAELKTLRQRVRELDQQILELASERQKMAQAIGQIKLALGMPIKDFAVEKTVLENSRKICQRLGLYEDLGSELIASLIKYSVIAQDEYHRRQSMLKTGHQKKILIVGGLGRMGLWQANFFASFGHRVILFDTRATIALPSVYPLATDLATEALDSDVIVLATPLDVSAKVLDDLTALRPSGLIFDLCSLKSPLRKSIKHAAEQGLRITSVHPMFGPNVDTLSGRNIIICHVASEQATAETFELYAGGTADLVSLTLEEHDLLMGYVLGVSHLINLVFARVISGGQLPFATLKKVASTTFNAQLQVTLPVVAENKELYYMIQAANEFTPQMLQSMSEALESYQQAIASQDSARFSQMMEESRLFFE